MHLVYVSLLHNYSNENVMKWIEIERGAIERCIRRIDNIIYFLDWNPLLSVQ